MKKLHLTIALLFLMLAGNIHAQQEKSYYFSKTISESFEDATVSVKESLKEQGFGIITEIDMDVKIAEKVEGADLKPYRILGACNPGFAYKTLQAEENIGLFLPCKVLIKEISPEKTEIVMVNPSELMKMLGNEALTGIADEVTERFKKALEVL